MPKKSKSKGYRKNTMAKLAGEMYKSKRSRIGTRTPQRTPRRK